MQHKCDICEKVFDSLWGLSNHNVRKHNIIPSETFIKYNLNGVTPTCECGCGKTPTFLGIKKGFRNYIRGHASKINNNWGHNSEAQKKSKETQKQKYQSGDLVIWNKGLTKEDDIRLNYGEKISLNKERSKKISKSLKGRKMSEDVMKRLDDGMRNYWSKEENREKQRLNQSKKIKEYYYKNKTKLELLFEIFLNEMNLGYVSQYTICGYNFDYYLPKHDIIIEVDGDFFHCNPSIYNNGPIYESQIKTIKNDKIKNNICEKTNGLTLLRFWESDINNRPEWVKEEILKNINK